MEGIRWLHRGALARAEVGGKAASLSEMLTAGFPVPVGFAVTAAAYREFELVSGLGARSAAESAALDSEDLTALRAASEAATAAAEESALPPAVRAQIAAAYEELVSLAGEACAVRSSATSEDSAGASFAGLYDSFLNVRGLTDVLDSVRHCYASLWSERAIRYRALKGVGGDDMAVVVMSLVPAEAAGIAFTAHPVTGERDRVVINASWGLGEAIVSGRVTPDSFIVEKQSLRLLEREVYEKTMAIFPHPDGGGTIETKLAPARANAPSISDDEACEIARLATEVERRFGPPQDVEWAIHSGRISLLQSRPITTL